MKGWQLLSRGDVRIMVGHCPDAVQPSGTGDHSYFGYLHVDEVDVLHEELVSRGALIQQPPADNPHGMREFLVATPDGHRLTLGKSRRETWKLKQSGGCHWPRQLLGLGHYPRERTSKHAFQVRFRT